MKKTNEKYNLIISNTNPLLAEYQSIENIFTATESNTSVSDSDNFGINSNCKATKTCNPVIGNYYISTKSDRLPSAIYKLSDEKNSSSDSIYKLSKANDKPSKLTHSSSEATNKPSETSDSTSELIDRLSKASNSSSKASDCSSEQSYRLEININTLNINKLNHKIQQL